MNAVDPWDGSLGSRPTDIALTMEAVLGPAALVSGSQAFPVSCAGRTERWHVKAPNNPQGAMVLVTEYLVSQVGALIEAPVCVVEPILIPADLAGYQVVNGPLLEEGVASGSMEIPDVREIRGTLDYREQDDNARRHAGVFAIFDWCWGDDAQWLVAWTDERRLHSHDHGFYFPPGGQHWSKADLAAHVDTPHPLSLAPDGLDLDELERLATALEGLAVGELHPILESVPAAWSVADADLEELGRYLIGRAPAVAQRLRDIRAKLEGR